MEGLIFHFGDAVEPCGQDSTAGISPTGCTQQGPLNSIGAPAEQSQFLHVFPFP